MKTLKRFTVIAVLALPSFLVGCTESDVYDPNNVRTIAPAANPFGEGFRAPDGFDWSTSTSVNLDVEVKDLFGGKYKYLVEVFTENPRINTAISPLTAGYAQGGMNYTTKITVPKDVSKIYIRQTTPGKSHSYHEYAVPEKDGSTLSCKLYSIAGGAATRADDAPGNAGTNIVPQRSYTEETDYTDEVEPSYPEAATATTTAEPAYGALAAGATFVIESGTTYESNGISCWSGTNPKIYVKGTWNIIGDWQSLTNVDVIICSGGKVVANGSQLSIANTSTNLTILKGGTLECKKLLPPQNSVTKNFGTLKVEEFYPYAGTEIRNYGTAIFGTYSTSSTDMVIFNASGCSFTIGYLYLGDRSKVHNYGNMTISGNVDCNTSTHFCNGANGTFNVGGHYKIQGGTDSNKAEFINFGTVNIGTTDTSDNELSINSHTIMYNALGATFNASGNFTTNGYTEVHNLGTMNITGTIQTCDDPSNIFFNGSGALFTCAAINGGAAIVNCGRMEMDKCENSSSDYMYNNCTLIIRESLLFRNIWLDNGSITGGQDETTGKWKPVPTVTGNTDFTFKLQNGSIIKATTFNMYGSGYITGENTGNNTEASMIQAADLIYNWTIYADGNLVLDGTPTNRNTLVLNSKGLGSNVSETDAEESIELIETCSGIVYQPEKTGESTVVGGSDPTPNPETGETSVIGTPPPPVTVSNSTGYTYAFEDQWPVYGDYDMNDVVMTIDNIVCTLDTDEAYVTSATISGQLKAVGAGRTIGLGIQFQGLFNSASFSSITLNGQSVGFESGQRYPTLIITDDVRKYMKSDINVATDGYFINTADGTDTKGISCSPASIDITINFNGMDILSEYLTDIKKYDVFIFEMSNPNDTSSELRREVHVIGYGATNKFDPSYKSNGQVLGNDDGSGEFRSTANLFWGIRIDYDAWRWPYETTIVTTAYPWFEDYMRSGGDTNYYWFKEDNAEVQYLYR